MATATKTKTWVDAEKLRFDDANANFDTAFTFAKAAGSVVHNDGSQSFTADQAGPYMFSVESNQAVRKRQADMSPEITGLTANCWLHGAAHAPAVGVPYMQWGDSVVDTVGLGAFNVPLPEAFPNDIMAVIVQHGDDLSSASATLHLYADPAASSLSNIRVVMASDVHVRLQWIVVGW